MRGQADLVEKLQVLVRASNLSDGAKVTLLEFVTCFWSSNKVMPTYSQLCATRDVARSTIQLHIEELENSEVLISVRLPGNRKRYRLDWDKLEREKVPSRNGKRKVVKSKRISRYDTSDLCRYFYFLLSEMTGETESCQRWESQRMKQVQKEYGSTTLVRAMEHLKKIHVRRRLPFSLETFFGQVDKLVDRS